MNYIGPRFPNLRQILQIFFPHFIICFGRTKFVALYESNAVNPSPSCIAQQQQTPRSCCWIWTGWQRRTVFDLHPVISQAQTTKSLLLFLLRLNIHQEPHPWSQEKKVPLFVPLLSNVLPFLKLPTYLCFVENPYYNTKHWTLPKLVVFAPCVWFCQFNFIERIYGQGP